MAARLFTPISLGGMVLSNRICVPPMCQCMAAGGIAQPWHADHYSRLAKSGAGLLVIECTAVSEHAGLLVIECTAVCAQGRITGKDLGLWNDEQGHALGGLVASVRAAAPDTRICVQISHAGRKAMMLDADAPAEEIVSCSALPYDERSATPVQLDEAGIRGIIEAFAQAAERAYLAGVDGVQIHAAHGYLIHQFFSPVSNRRTDAWGGSLENRMRFGLSVIEAIRKRVPKLPLMLRIAATDWIEGGWQESDAVEFVRRAADLGVVAVDVTAGGLSPQQKSPQKEPGYQVCYASAIKRGTGLPTAASGLITDPLQAEGILVSGQADLVSVGRGVLHNPSWGWMAAQSLNAFGAIPPPYFGAF